MNLAKPFFVARFGRPVDEVDCPECGARYDSDGNAFCPRCGSERKAPARDATLASAERTQPGRRRVQAGGLILAVLGGLAALQFLIGAIVPADPDPATLEMLSDVGFFRDLPGGEVVLLMPPGSVGNYTLETLDGNATTGTAMNGTTLSLESAFMNLTVAFDGREYVRMLYVPQGEHEAVRFEDDGDSWVSAGAPSALRGIAAFMAFFALLVVVGGVCAVRLRQRRLAIMAIALAALPGLILLFLAPPVGLLLLALPGVAAYLILSGRQHFR